MSEKKSEIRIPITGGVAAARKKLKELRRKEPSDRVVGIIEEVTKERPEQERDQNDKVAAPRTPRLIPDLEA